MSWFGTGASQYRLPVVTLKLGMKMYEVFFGGRGGYMKMIMKQQPGRCSSMQSRSSTSNRFSAQPLLLELKDPKISRPRTSNHRGTSFCVDLFHFLPVWTTYFGAIRVLKLVVQCQAQALPQLLFVDFGYFGCFSNGGTPQKQQKNSLVGENKKKWFHVMCFPFWSILAHSKFLSFPKSEEEWRTNRKGGRTYSKTMPMLLKFLKRCWPLWKDVDLFEGSSPSFIWAAPEGTSPRACCAWAWGLSEGRPNETPEKKMGNRRIQHLHQFTPWDLAWKLS